jgi:hypothetical protein
LYAAIVAKMAGKKVMVMVMVMEMVMEGEGELARRQGYVLGGLR